MQICINWGLQHGTSVIPKGTSNEDVVGYLDVIDWELSSEDFEVSVLVLICIKTAVIVFFYSHAVDQARLRHAEAVYCVSNGGVIDSELLS